jgi:phage shock protein PspC (stress-responsive transcriptional regulator)
MNMDDRRDEGPDQEQEGHGEEPGADEPTPEEPLADGSAEEAAEPHRADEPPGGEQPLEGDEPRGGGQPHEREQPPGPEDPRGAQAPPPPDDAPTRPLPPQPRRLLRSRSNRVIGGVCGGLGQYFNVDPILFRIAAVVFTLVGGAGLLFYLAALVLMPSEPADTAAAQPPGEGRNRALVIALVVVALLVAWPFLLGGGAIAAGILFPLAFLVAAGVLVWWLVSGEGPSGDAGDIARRAALGIGVLVLCGLVALAGAWAAAAGGGTIVAILVIASGAAIVAGAFLKPVRWLVLPALALGLSAGVVSAAGIDLDGGVGDKTYRPTSTLDLRDRYELGIGELEVDLRTTDLPAGDRPLELDVGVGEARLIVPENVCVATDAKVGVGAVRVFERDSGGVDVDVTDQRDARPDTTRLLVDADIGVGALNVVHDPGDADDHDFDRDFDDDFEAAFVGDGNAACTDMRVSEPG